MKFRTASVLVLGVLCMGAAEAHTFLWWADGWRGRSEDGRRILHIQTPAYSGAFDVEAPQVLRLVAAPAHRVRGVPSVGGGVQGRAHDAWVAPEQAPDAEAPEVDAEGGAAMRYLEAARQPNPTIPTSSSFRLEIAVEVEGVAYLCVAAAEGQEDRENYPVRIIESGRWLQRFDILNLRFENTAGEVLPVQARLEVVAWPDRLHLIAEITAEEQLLPGALALALGQYETRLREVHPFSEGLAPGESVIVPLAWVPGAEEPHPAEQATVEVRDARAEDAALPVAYEAARGWWHVDLPERQWELTMEPDRLDRFPLRLRNDSPEAKTFRLLFAMDGPFTGITGMTPMLRDAEGNPTGIPVQISKNWHRFPERPMRYEGPWFHGASVITVPPGETWEGELAIAYAHWGGVPAASHAQLCLIGWGTNQLWEQAAIGSWGESICYDPDVNLERSMIDDIRPLMVTGMRGGEWEWTHNVGGGDFLVYYDADERKQFLTRMRTAHLAYGPNLTEAVYAGVSADGKIAARIHVSTPRTDDVHRAYHRVRYDVLEETPFSRLAFYQLGADNYNDHQFTTLARGNRDGVIEEWEPGRGGLHYLREGIPVEGEAAWFSLHGGERPARLEHGAWADRGLVLRAWEARLGGEVVAAPTAAVFGTENGPPSANIELTAPPGLKQLEPGDYVAFEVELLVLPQRAEDYYGPNEALRAHLAEHGGTWQSTARLAAGNHLEVAMERGTLRRKLPIEVEVDAGEGAEFTLTGGAGYAPLSFTGLSEIAGYVLTVDGEAVDQSVHGNDFWQCTEDAETGAWVRTYNIPLDAEDGERATRRIRFERE